MHDRQSTALASQKTITPQVPSVFKSANTNLETLPHTIGIEGDFSRVAITHRAPVSLLPKLRIDPVDSPLEREADRVAAAVMRSPAPVSNLQARSASIGLQRKCDTCGKDEEEKAVDKDKKVVQRFSTTSESTNSLPIVQRKCAS